MGDLDDIQLQPILQDIPDTQWYHWVLKIKQIYKTTEYV